MNKPKRVTAARKPVVKKSTPKSKPRGLDPKVLAEREFWQKQIDNLVGREFVSLDAAIEAIVDEVLNVIAPGEKHDPEERAMLQTLLVTDPDFSEDLRNVLKIKAPKR
jgi:hypothetical protein